MTLNERRGDQRGELLIDAPGMGDEALSPVQPDDRRRSDPVDDLDRAVEVVLADPAVDAGLAKGVGRSQRISHCERTLEPLHPHLVRRRVLGGRGRGPWARSARPPDLGHARPTKRAIRSHASSIFSRLVA